MALTFAVLLVNLQDQSRHILRKSGSAPSNRWLHNPQKLDSKGEKTVLPHRGATVQRPRRRQASPPFPDCRRRRQFYRSDYRLQDHLSFHPAPNFTTQENTASQSIIAPAIKTRRGVLFSFFRDGEGHCWGHLKLSASRSVLRFQGKRRGKKSCFSTKQENG